jgi:hypothetical protein
VLSSQSRTDSGRTRWFVVGGPNSNEILRESGAAEPLGSRGFDELPSMDTEDAARKAHRLWLENNQPGTQDQDQDEQGAGNGWTEITTRGSWSIQARETSTGKEFRVEGELPDGTIVYLAPGGEVISEPHIFPTVAAVNDALAAYRERVANGDVDEDRQPTGPPPGPPDGSDDGDKTAGTLGSIATAARSNPLLAVGAVLVIYYLYRQYGGDL